MGSKRKTTYYMSLSRLIQKEYYPEVQNASIVRKVKNNQDPIEYLSNFGETGEYQVNIAYGMTKNNYLAGLPKAYVSTTGYTRGELNDAVKRWVSDVDWNTGSDNPIVSVSLQSIDGVRVSTYITYMLKRDHNLKYDPIRDYVVVNGTYYSFVNYNKQTLASATFETINVLYRVHQTITTVAVDGTQSTTQDTVTTTVENVVALCLPKTATRSYIYPNLTENGQTVTKVSYPIPGNVTTTTSESSTKVNKGTVKNSITYSPPWIETVTLQNQTQSRTFEFQKPPYGTNAATALALEVKYFDPMEGISTMYLPTGVEVNNGDIDYQPTPVWQLRKDEQDINSGSFPDAEANTDEVLSKVGFPIKDLIEGYHGRSKGDDGKYHQEDEDPCSKVNVESVFVLLGMSHNGDIMGNSNYDDFDPMVSKLLWHTVEFIYEESKARGVTFKQGQEVHLNFDQDISWIKHNTPNREGLYYYGDDSTNYHYELNWGYYPPIELENDNTMDDKSVGEVTRFKDTSRLYIKEYTLYTRQFLRTEQTTIEIWTTQSDGSEAGNTETVLAASFTGLCDVYQTTANYVYEIASLPTDSNTILRNKNLWGQKTEFSFVSDEELESGQDISIKDQQEAEQFFKDHGSLSSSTSEIDSYEEKFKYSYKWERGQYRGTKPNVKLQETSISRYRISKGTSLFLKQKIDTHKTKNIVLYNLNGFVEQPGQDKKWNVVPLQEYMLWPLSMRAWNRLTIIEKTKAYNDIWYMQLFMHKTTKIKWYQSGIFGFILMVVMIVIVVVVSYFCPPCGASLSAIAAKMTIGTFLAGLIISVAISMLANIALKWIVKHTGGFLKYFLIYEVITAYIAAQVVSTIFTGGASAIQSPIFIINLAFTVANMLIDTFQYDLSIKMRDLENKANDWADEYQDEMNYLKELQEETTPGMTVQDVVGINLIPPTNLAFTQALTPSMLTTASIQMIFNIDYKTNGYFDAKVHNFVDNSLTLMIGD